MTLTSASTDTQVAAAYEDNADYRESNDRSKAALFIQACRFILHRTPKRATLGAESAEYDLDQIRQELNGAVAWLESHPDTTAPALGDRRRLSTERFRE